jgi:DNA-binding protein H-NS
MKTLIGEGRHIGGLFRITNVSAARRWGTEGAHGGDDQMKQSSIETMSLDELWTMHAEIVEILVSRINSEKVILEKRLAGLGSRSANAATVEKRPERRFYPSVEPKYQNPQRPFETWSGRGRQPRWVSDLLQSGKNIDDLRIASASSGGFFSA